METYEAPLVSIVMGSVSDWETMQHAAAKLKEFEVPHECKVVSAHRTPTLLAEHAAYLEAKGVEIIIAGAGGAAHLPGMMAAHSLLPVFGVPIESQVLRGLDSLLSIVQMPAGIPVGTLAIGKAGAINAAMLAISVLATTRSGLRAKLKNFRHLQAAKVQSDLLPPLS